MSIFSRLFKIGQSEAHSVVDKLEDPIKMTEQGIRDLRKDLHQAMTSLAEVKAIAIRTRREADSRKKAAAEYERKAMLLLQKGQGGQLGAQEADRLAAEALTIKEQHANDAVKISQEAERHEQMAASLHDKVNKIKSAIKTYENDLTTLKARARTAASTRKINQHLSKIDTSGTIAMLEKMKAKVEQEESLAQAYGELAGTEKSVTAEIDAALTTDSKVTASASLLELKKKMGIE